MGIRKTLRNPSRCTALSVNCPRGKRFGAESDRRAAPACSALRRDVAGRPPASNREPLMSSTVPSSAAWWMANASVYAPNRLLATLPASGQRVAGWMKLSADCSVVRELPAAGG